MKKNIYSNKLSFVNWIRFINSDLKLFTCDYCKKVFKNSGTPHKCLGGFRKRKLRFSDFTYLHIK